MGSNSTTVWTSWSNVFLGLLLVATPITFGIERAVLFWNDCICGILLIFFGLAARRAAHPLIPWLGALVGVWLQAAPLIFWAKQPICYLSDTLVGMLAMIFFIVVPPLRGGAADTGSAQPPGWSYNPSSWSQRLPIIICAVICWSISRYLATYQLGYIDHVWEPFFDPGTEAVLTSKISKLFPVSDAGLGAMAYSLEFLLACQGGERRWRTSPWMCVLSGIFIVPVSLVSVILIISQPIGVGAWCTLCLCTALFALITVPLGADELILTLQYLRRSKEKPLWRLFFEGGGCSHGKEDQRSPSGSASLGEIFRASLWGITMPITLLASVLIGVMLMFMPWIFGITDPLMRDSDYILGPLSIVISITALSELLRFVRWGNLLIAAILVMTHGMNLIHLSLAVILALLSIPRGKICEYTQFE